MKKILAFSVLFLVLFFAVSARAESFQCQSCRKVVESVKHRVTDGIKTWICCQSCFVVFSPQLSDGRIKEIK